MQTLTAAVCLALVQVSQVTSLSDTPAPSVRGGAFQGYGAASIGDDAISDGVVPSDSIVDPTRLESPPVYPQDAPSPTAAEPYPPYAAEQTVVGAAEPTAAPEPVFRDPAVRPASGTQSARGVSGYTRGAAPVTPVEAPASSRAAESLVAICAVTDNELPQEEGTRHEAVTLQQVLASSDRGVGQTAAVQRYWDLAIATGEYRFALEEERFLEELQATSGRSSALYAALTSARARAKKVHLDLLARQERLKEVSSRFGSDVLPWPADTPLVTAYRTRFETLFAGQPRPVRLLQIDRALPMMLEHLELEAEAVMAAESAVEDERRGGQVGLSTLLDSHRRLRDQRRGFLTAVAKYNQQIAEYALAVTGPHLPAEQRVATLIKTRGDMVRVGGGRVRR